MVEDSAEEQYHGTLTPPDSLSHHHRSPYYKIIQIISEPWFRVKLDDTNMKQNTLMLPSVFGRMASIGTRPEPDINNLLNIVIIQGWTFTLA